MLNEFMHVVIENADELSFDRTDFYKVRCVLMRGGTSKGPFFLDTDLPNDPALRDWILVSAMGSGHPLEIDGIGGGNPLSSKVAIVGRSDEPTIDVNYRFGQVDVLARRIDYSPNCGNMLAAVGPFAIEVGLVEPVHPETQVRIRNTNTGALIEATVQTPNGRVRYGGEHAIDGVPGTAAPVALTFVELGEGGASGTLPTGAAVEHIDGIEVSCIVGAIPVVLVRAEAFGVTGYESAAELNANALLRERLERVRVEAGERMGIIEPGTKVIPKPVLLAPARDGGNLTCRYFMPHQCHSALATTGAVTLAIATLIPGTLAAELATGISAPAIGAPSFVTLEHPGGTLTVRLDLIEGHGMRASLMRTARRLFEGHVLVPTMPGRPAIGEGDELAQGGTR